MRILCEDTRCGMMTRLKGFLGVCAVLLFVSGALYVFSRGSLRGKFKRPSVKPPIPESSEHAPTEEIVVPERITFTEQQTSNDRVGDLKQEREPDIQKANDKSVAHLPVDHVKSATTSPVVPGINEDSQFSFDPHGTDSLVVIHIQKTGGSDFLRHLITATKDGKYLCSLSEDTQTDIQTNSLGPKGVVGQKVMCPRDLSKPRGEQWLISEKNLGWICQLHASFSDFKECLPKLNNPKVNLKSHFHYMTILRHPVLRYLSEYFHVRRNATWAKRRECAGRKVTDEEMPPCYPGFYKRKPWTNVTIEKFLSCQSNWANNRQTHMLADLERLGCYGNTLYPQEEKDRLMLESAKENLRNFAFFALTEYQKESVALFGKTFGIKLKLESQQRPMSSLHSAPVLQEFWNSSSLYDRIASVNKLDMELYEYALKLFSERVKALGFKIDRDVVSKEIAAMNTEAVAKTAKKYKRFNLHGEFLDDTS